MPDNTKHSDLNRERKRAGLLLAAALEYAAKGLPVFPCLNKLGDPGNKRPLTKHGFKDASCDPKVVSGWWDRWPTALIGMPTGEHFCVLDLDCKKGKNGLAVVSDWSERSPLIAITGSDGRHLYFLPDDEIGCTTDEIALGVDTRGKGGYVIVPPSEGYSWVNGHDLSDLSKLPPWPDDLRPSGAARERKEGQYKAKEDLVATDPDQLAFAVGVIPNNSSNYLKWKKMGMAIFAAMADRDRGFQVFDEFSKRWTCGEYDAVGVKKAWEQIEGSPPDDIGAGSIYRWADQAAPGWNDGYQELKRARIEGSEEERAKANARESELLDALAKTKGLDYDRQRKKAAKELGVSFRALDEEVKARREDAVAAPLYGHWIVEPWPEPVDGDALLRDIINRIHRHVVISGNGALVIGLWIMMAWVHDAIATHSPILNITSAEPESGKSTTMGLIAFLMPKGIASVEVSEAALYRAIQRWSPSFCFDEFDSILADDDKAALRSIINSGHTRAQGVLRCVGDDKTPELFSTFAPKALGMIGRRLPATTMSRCIFVELRRHVQSETVVKFKHEDDEELATLRRRLFRWASDSQEALRDAKPAMPDELLNRRADNWTLLLAIADLCFGAEDFGEKARTAALEIEKTTDSRTISALALADIKSLFEAKPEATVMRSADIVEALVKDEEKPWRAYRRGKELTQKQLAELLARYRIVSQTVRPAEGPTAKGYRRQDFEEAWKRYL